MAATILITGANSSLPFPLVDYLLKHLPDLTLVLHAIANSPEAQVFVRELDLSSLSTVHNFSHRIATEVAENSIPRLASIICAAYHWNLVGPMQLTSDGYEMTVQVSYLSHVALVLRLLGSFRAQAGGRIILFTSDGHESGKNQLEQIPPSMSAEAAQLDLLVKPGADDSSADALGHGFHRYANAKLALVMWTHALNRRLQRDDKLKNITAVVMNPGNLSDSRALRVNTPLKLVILSNFVVRPLRPLLNMTVDPTARTANAAAVDVARLATNKAHPGHRGYFTLLKPDQGSDDSRDEATQEALWTRTAKWVGITSQDTALGSLIE
ncbi:NAD(P)-binding protein [Cryphonectria parasitica EP155]|uniref:NAD(P)-binding protein n=1 Tax=Cryphonectria parasitica (strain ATCC 38755 / EP155) TaxID=660469 RepID=A0A9P4Y1L6_CRYP1|nr:NAD(P)-binding protein [Cryphonectria parasitica EP155]KAF3765292.1 NAD(P)-binding protein [Cryphonectria parasitica EP155]